MPISYRFDGRSDDYTPLTIDFPKNLTLLNENAQSLQGLKDYCTQHKKQWDIVRYKISINKQAGIDLTAANQALLMNDNSQLIVYVTTPPLKRQNSHSPLKSEINHTMLKLLDRLLDLL